MANFDEKELQQFQKRIKELANKAFLQNIYTFTDFLGLPEQDVFWKTIPQIGGSGYKLFGGRENADRVIVRFGDPKELGYEVEFPIVCVHIEPVNRKFADQLTHRDFLGALMNLGIDRAMTGDIIVGEKEAFLFCRDSMADYICENLRQVKHTNVVCSISEDFELPEQAKPVPETVQVSSVRVDALIAKVYKLSREESQKLFATGLVYIDGRGCENTGRQLKPQESVNVRGYGKFIFLGEKGESRKGKKNVEVAVYR